MRICNHDQSPWLNVADPAGVKPANSWSPVGYTSNWATEADIYSLSSKNWMSIILFLDSQNNTKTLNEKKLNISNHIHLYPNHFLWPHPVNYLQSLLLPVIPFHHCWRSSPSHWKYRRGWTRLNFCGRLSAYASHLVTDDWLNNKQSIKLLQQKKFNNSAVNIT